MFDRVMLTNVHDFIVDNTETFAPQKMSDRSHAFLGHIVARWACDEWKRNFRIGLPHFISCELKSAPLTACKHSNETCVCCGNAEHPVVRLRTNIKYQSVSLLFGVDLPDMYVAVHCDCTAIAEVLAQ